MKQNDYIIASLNNPEFNPGDFRTLGMDLDNTLMLSKDEYLKSDYIKQNDAFKDENGEFSKSKFDTFYDNSLRNFLTFSDIETDFQYDMFDYRRYDTEGANVKDPKLKFFQITNPQELTIGDGWVNEINESPLSDRERASKSKIYDYEKGEFLDYSPNEHSLVNNPIEWFKDLFDEPLVLAQYEEDGTHIDPFSGREVKHTKGEYKIGSDGKYFYETLGGRDLGSKQVLSKFDTLTVDGEGLNKYDFFDSDDRDKSVGGVIMKTAAAIAPMFLPGPWAAAYSAMLVTRELTKALPMLDGLYGAITGNNESTAFTRLANNAAGYASSFSSSQSDYASQNTVSWEGLANLMSDVALQWGLQKVIAQSLAKLKGTDKLAKEAEESAKKLWEITLPLQKAQAVAKGISEDLIKKRFGDAATWKASELGQALLTNAMKKVFPAISKANELGGDLSLMYMAIVSNTNVYQSMLEHGLTKREAMSVAMGSTLGMFAVDKHLHLGESFFGKWGGDDGLTAIFNALAKENQKWLPQLANIAKASGKKGADKTATAILSTKNFIKPKYETFFTAMKNHTLGAVGKSIVEGTEEVSEELVSDLSKQIYEWAAQWDTTDLLFGNLTTDNVEAFDNLGEDPLALNKMFARYGMNFLGGFMGGGLFYGVEKWQNRKVLKSDPKDENLVNVIRNYGTQRILDKLEENRKNGKLASKQLSVDYETVDGQNIWLSADENHMSQNDFVYNQLKNTILSIDKIIHDVDLDLAKTDEELRKQLTLGEARYQRLLEILDESADYSKDYINRYLKLIDNYTAILLKIDELNKRKPDPKNASVNFDADIQKLETKRDEIKSQIELFNSGENAIDYMAMMLFIMDDRLASKYYSSNFGSWLKNISKDDSNPHDIRSLTDFDKLDASLKRVLRDAYMQYKNSGQLTKDAEEAWMAFKDMRAEISPELENLQAATKTNEKYIELMHLIYDKDKSPFSQVKDFKPENITTINWDDRTYEEMRDDALYNTRNTKNAGETDELFEARKKERELKLKKIEAAKLTELSYLEALEKVKDLILNAGNLLSPQDKRHLLGMLNIRQRDIVNQYVENSGITGYSKVNPKHIQEILDELKEDLSNMDDVRLKVIISAQHEYKDKVESDVRNVYGIREKLIESNNNFISQILEDLVDQGRLSSDEVEKYYADDDEGKLAYWYLEDIGLKDLNKHLVDKTGNHITFIDFADPKLNDIDNLYVELGGKILSLREVFLQGIRDHKLFDVAVDNYSAHVHLALNEYKLYDQRENRKVTLTGLFIESLFRKGLFDKANSLGVLNAKKTAIDKRKLNTLIRSEALKYKPTTEDENSFYKKVGLDAKGIKQKSVLKTRILTDLFGARVAKLFDESPENYTKVNQKLKLLNINEISDNNGKPNEDEKNNLLSTIREEYGGLADKISFVQDPSGLWKVDINATEDSLKEIGGIDLEKGADDGVNAKPLTIDVNEETLDDGAVLLILNGSIFQKQQKDIEDQVNNSFDVLRMQIEGDEKFDYIATLKNTKPVNNPVIEIVKKLGMQLHRDTKNVEELLERMSSSLQGTTRTEFTLSDPDRAALDEADDLLELCQTFLWSCYDNKDFVNPFPHNQLYNEMIDKHQLHLEKLPEIDAEVASLYWKTLLSLRLEIGLVDKSNEFGYTRGSYRYWDAQNAVNKGLKLIKASEMSTKTKLALIQDSKIGDKSIFVGRVKDGDKYVDINLLEGIDAITDTDKEVRLYKIEKLFYDNVQKLLKEHSSLTLEQIFDGTSISDLVSDKALLRDLSVANADETFNIENLTPMDKAMYFISLTGLSPEEFYAALAEFINKHQNIAPLDVLATPTRIGMMFVKSPELYKSGLRWLYKLAGCTESSSYLINGLFIPGNGGAGKTEVCIKGIAEYAQDGGVLLAGPTEGQKTNLSGVGAGKVSLVDDILIQILGNDNFAQCQSDSQNESTWGSGSMRAFLPSSSVSKIPVYAGNFTMKDLGVRAIIIDEATHIPTWKLTILSQYADKFNCALILVGDNYLQGYLTDGFLTNLNSEYCFCGRSSRLAITLRDANLQKYVNIKKATNLIHLLTEVPLDDPNIKSSVTDRKIKLDLAIENFKHFEIGYYNGDLLNGDIVVKDLTEELLGNVEVPKKIAYVGSNSTVYEMLKKKFGDSKVVQFVSEVAILGQEFDSVVVDVSWNKIDFSKGTEAVANDAGNFLRRFYTLSTRGKTSAIFIDASGNLESMVHPVEEQYKNTVTNFGDTAKSNFRTYFEERITKYKIPTDTPTKYIPTKPSTPPKPTTTTSTTTSGSGSTTTGGGTGGTTTASGSTSGATTTPSGTTSSSTSSTTAPAPGGGAKASIGKPITPMSPTVEPEEKKGKKKSGGKKVDDDIRKGLIKILSDAENIRDSIIEEYPVQFDDKGEKVVKAGNQARAYGSATLAGVIRTEGVDENGEVSHIYTLPKDSETLSDLGIFMDGKQEQLSNKEDVRKYVKKLIDFKNLFLYQHDYLKYRQHFTDFYGEGVESNDVITEEDYNAIINGDPSHIKIVVAKRNESLDNFVGLSDLDSQKMEIGSEGLVYKIVAEFTTKSGKKARLTLGLMADPKTYRSRRESIIKRLQKYIDEGNHSVEDVRWAKAYMQELSELTETAHDPIEGYQKYIDELEGKWKSLNNPEAELVVSPPSQLKYSKTSVLRNVYQGNEKTTRLRFDTYDGYDGQTFRGKYGDRLAISDVYIYIPSDSEAKENHPSYSGKPVVFMSADTLLDSNELKDAWLREQAHHQHSVRAVMLDNIGVTLELLCDREYKDLFRTEKNGGFNKLPFENREMGIRMLISLWNWRANLKNFETQLGEFRKNNDTLNSVSDKKIDEVLSQMHSIYKGIDAELNKDTKNSHGAIHPTDEQYKEGLLKNLSPDNWKIAEQILVFNSKIEPYVREFRLGAGNEIDGSNSRGYIIRDLLISKDNTLYYSDEDRAKGKTGSRKIYGIYTNLTTLLKMSKMTNALCQLIFGPENNPYYKLIDKDGNKINSEDYIDITKFNGYLLTIADIKSTEAPFHWILGTTETDKDMSLRLIKAIPINIVKIVQRSIAYGKTERRGTVEGLPEYERYDNKTKTKKEVGFRPWEWDNVDHIKITYQELNDEKEAIGEPELVVDMDIHDLISYGKQKDKSDLTLAKMLDLCFHGTTEEFIETRLQGKDHTAPYNEDASSNPYFVAQAEDAYFKYGFLSDPVANYKRGDNEGSEFWARSLTKSAMYTLRTRVDLPFVYFDYTATEESKKEEKNEGTPEPKNVLDDARGLFFTGSLNDMEESLNNDVGLRKHSWLREIVLKELGITDNIDDWENLKYKISETTSKDKKDSKQKVLAISYFDVNNDRLTTLTIKEDGAIGKNSLAAFPEKGEVIKLIKEELVDNLDESTKEVFNNLVNETKELFGHDDFDFNSAEEEDIVSFFSDLTDNLLMTELDGLDNPINLKGIYDIVNVGEDGSIRSFIEAVNKALNGENMCNF